MAVASVPATVLSNRSSDSVYASACLVSILNAPITRSWILIGTHNSEQIPFVTSIYTASCVTFPKRIGFPVAITLPATPLDNGVGSLISFFDVPRYDECA